MDMRVDEIRHRDAAAAVDYLGPGRRQIAPDLRDLLAFDEDVAAVEVADFRIQREDESVLDECLVMALTLTASVRKNKALQRNA
jgi:hypothetical protein